MRTVPLKHKIASFCLGSCVTLLYITLKMCMPPMWLCLLQKRGEVTWSCSLVFPRITQTEEANPASRSGSVDVEVTVEMA